MSNKEQYDIDAFLHGELTQDETKSFLEKMEGDAEFMQEVDLTRTIMLSTEALEKESFKSLLENIHLEHTSNEEETTKPTSNRKHILLAAFIFLALLIGAYFYVTSNTSHAPADIFAEFYEIEDLHLSYRATVSSSELQTLEQLFNAQEYSNYLSSLSQNEALIRTHPDLLLAKAQAEIALHKYSAAEESLVHLEKVPLYDRSAKWQKALLLFKLGRTEEATAVLRYLSDDADKFGKLATRVLDKM